MRLPEISALLNANLASQHPSSHGESLSSDDQASALSATPAVQKATHKNTEHGPSGTSALHCPGADLFSSNRKAIARKQQAALKWAEMRDDRAVVLASEHQPRAECASCGETYRSAGSSAQPTMENSTTFIY